MESVSLGPQDVNADFIPLLKPRDVNTPFRINVNEGDMLMMQGNYRHKWARGIPYILKEEKYAVMFKFRKLGHRRLSVIVI